MTKAATVVAAFAVLGDLLDYSERQSALVRARMPMKVGKKIVEAKTVAMSAMYMVFS